MLRKKAGNDCRAMSAGSEDVVHQASPSPRGERPQRRADEERAEETGADQEDRPRQRVADHLGHGRRVVGGGDAEVEVRDPAQVDDVVVPDRVVAAAEQRLVGLDDPGWPRSGQS